MRRKALGLVTATALVAAGLWIVQRDRGATFSDHPRATRLAFARGSQEQVTILYHRCGYDDFVPYVDVWEVIGDDLRELEVSNEIREETDVQWIAWRHPVGESIEPLDPYEGELPPARDVEVTVHLYSALIARRWHVWVKELPVRDLPELVSGSNDVVTGRGETMTEREWADRANDAC